MSKNDPQSEHLSRRAALRLCMAPLGVAAAGWFVGCAEDNAGSDNRRDEGAANGDASAAAKQDASSDDGRAQSEDDDAQDDDARDDDGQSDEADTQPADSGAGAPSVDPDAGAQADEPDAASDAQTRPDDAAGQTDTPWATGGTKSMQGGYPDPFASGGTGAACVLFPAMTLGPCYANGPARREDISDGMTGLPVRLSFLVVDGDGCTPVPDAEIDIWHTGSNGVYSAFARGICNPDRVDVGDELFCRGTQVTNASGRADFSTVFPGWYSGRAIHIHFTVRVGGRSFLTSQLFFEDALNSEILSTAEYRDRGMPDTTSRNDGILRGVNLEDVLFAWAKRPDGALHGWKTLSLRS